ncbi:hypothetical protein BGZ94_000288 [Podila epigama]|nr:hypothetical protein BGZ94_000288 [Podila epigama]
MANSHATTSIGTLGSQHLFVACPCLNVKLHLANEPTEASQLVGQDTKLGLAGVSVEQKILCSMSISGDMATVRCDNCNNVVYTFSTPSNSVQLEATSLAFLNSSVLFSPVSGIVVPSEAIVIGEDIAKILKDPHYSKAFRLVLSPNSAQLPQTESTNTLTSTTNVNQRLYQPHLEKVRTILDKELESNIAAQQLQTEARIEAYKSQQLLALQESIANTKREKDRLWEQIQNKASVPPPPSVGDLTGGHTNEQGLLPDSPLHNSTHPFDGPSTLPVRLTSASRLDSSLGSYYDRRKSAVAEMAMSMQFREFDQRMASNSLRRQSIVPEANMPPVQTQNPLSSNHLPQKDTNAAATSPKSSESLSEPAPKSKKRVTIGDTISIVVPKSTVSDTEGENSANILSGGNSNYVPDEDDDDESDEDDVGVVFDLDEELGMDDEIQDVNSGDDDFYEDENDETTVNGGQGYKSHTTGSIGISVNRASLPKPGMVVGSLRANYLRRQRGLERHRKSLKEGELEDDDDDDDDDDEFDDDGKPPAAYFGTSLPIQIQARPPTVPPPPAKTSAIASSLALPPGSSPAGAMLQRRLSRAYGNDILPEPHARRGSTTLPTTMPTTTSTIATTTTPTTSQRHPTSHPMSNLGSSFAENSLHIPGTAAGAVIIDPLMLLEEEHDADEREDRQRNHRQQFSSINHRRDMEQRQQQGLDAATAGTMTSSTVGGGSGEMAQGSLARSMHADFEPPHLYSARTYVGSTPWEMPTRITVKSGGYQREGTQLDKQIALEMALEQEKERNERRAAVEEAGSSSTNSNISRTGGYGSDSGGSGHHTPSRQVEKIEEGEEEIDEEDEERNESKKSLRI